MQKMGISLILIILGIIVITFPILGLVSIAAIPEFLVLILSIGLILDGIFELSESKGASLGIPLLIFGIIALILGVGTIFNSVLFKGLLGLIIWIISLLLIFTGITRIFSKNGDNRCGVKDIITGSIILLVWLFLPAYPWLLGILLGLWLLTTGMRMRHNPNFLKNWN